MVSASHRKVGPWIEAELLNGWTVPKGFRCVAYRVHVDIEGVQLETVGLAEPPTPPDGAEPDYSFPVFQLPEDLAAEFRGADSGWNCYMIENRTSRCTVDDDGFFYVEVM